MTKYTNLMNFLNRLLLRAKEEKRFADEKSDTAHLEAELLRADLCAVRSLLEKWKARESGMVSFEQHLVHMNSTSMGAIIKYLFLESGKSR